RDWQRSAAGDDRKRLHLREEPLAARAACPPQHPPSDGRTLPGSHERQGRTHPPDDGPRMGLRTRLPLTSTTQPGTATLARPLQPATTAQLTQRPATDQPRSQRPWVGQLAAESREERDEPDG